MIRRMKIGKQGVNYFTAQKNQGCMYTLLNDTYKTMRLNNPKANSREHLIPRLGLGLWLELELGFGFGPSQKFQGKRFPWKISSTT